MDKRNTPRARVPLSRLAIQLLEPRHMLSVGDLLSGLANPAMVGQAGAEFGFATAADGSHLVVGAPATDADGIANVGQAYIFDTSTGDLLLTLENPFPAPADQFGHAVAISGQHVVVGDFQSDAGATDAGSVYVFDRTTGDLVHHLTNPTPAAFDFFGYSVAVDGDTIVVGAFLDDTSISDGGATYIFDAASGNLNHTLTRTSAASFDYFGISVDISGARVVVGAERVDGGAIDDGEVFVYDASSGSLLETYVNPTPENFEYFGHSVAISGDRLVVGAHRDDTGIVNAGVAYVVDLVTGNFEHTLTNPSPALSDNFGFDVDVAGDVVLIGAYRDDQGARDAGIAHQFDAVSGSLLHTYANPNPSELAYFGSSVTISSATAVVGAYWNDVTALDAGMVYMFDPLSGNSAGSLMGPATSSFDYFGQALAVTNHKMAVGAPLDDSTGTDAGIVHIYDSLGNLEQTIDNPAPNPFDNFGSSVAMSGNILVVGADSEEVNGIINAGSVYVFDVTTGALLHTITSPTPTTNDNFGGSVSISGSEIGIGAPREDAGAADSGAVYVFDATAGSLIQHITNPNPTDFDHFGAAVAIDDGKIAVGAHADDAGATDAGAAYVFDTSTGDLIASLANPWPEDHDYFGRSVSLASNRVLVGSPRKNLGQTNAGGAYLLDAVSGDLIAEVANPVPTVGSFFGEAVALSSNFAVIGAYASSVAGPQAGAAFLFEAAAGTYRGDLIAPQPATGDFFGFAVAASESLIVAGAPQVDGTSADRGAAFVFDGQEDAMAPIADAGGPYAADEGESFTLDASASHDDNQATSTLLFEWDLDYDGASFDVDTQGIAPSVGFTDDFTGDVAVRVTDNSGLMSIATASISISNVAPSVAVDTTSLTVDEGALAQVGGSVADPGSDTISLTASIGTVVDNGDGTWSWSYLTTDGPDESDTVTITAEDDDGGMNSATFDLAVENLAPSLTADASAVVVLVGDTATNSGMFSDAGNDTVDLTANIGDVVDNGDGTWSWNLASATVGDSQTVRIDATDSDGAVTTITFELLVALTFANSPSVTISEGEIAENMGVYAPPIMGETLALSASVGTVIDNADGTWSWSYDALDGPDDSATVTITADYSGGAQGFATFDLVVENVAPNLSVDANPITVKEGDTAENSGTFVDVGQDAVTISASVGSVVDNGDGTWSWSWATSDGPADSQLVTISAEDEDAAIGTVAFDLVVNNADPKVSVDSASVTVPEGMEAAVTGTVFDLDAVTLSASLGDITDNGDGTWSWSFLTSDGPAESQTVTVTAEDSDGASGTATFDLVVDNVDPDITVDQATVTVDEGDTAVNSGLGVDPGSDTLTISADVGDVVDNGDGTWIWTFDTSDGPDQSQLVTITANDDDGGSDTVTFDLIVDNAAPNLALDLDFVGAVEGSTAVNTGTVSDPGDDTVMLTASVGQIVDNGDGTWGWSLAAVTTADSQQVEISATDSDGSFVIMSFQLDVQVIVASSPAIAVHEGQTATNSGQYQLPDVGETVSLTASVGTVTDDGDGEWSWTFVTTDGPDDSATVTITANYSRGPRAETEFTLVVNNLAPELAVDVATVDVTEGDAAQNSGTISDLGGDSFTLSASLGEVVDNLDGTWSWTYDVVNGDPSSQTVDITATDDDGGISMTSFTLNAANLAPELTAEFSPLYVPRGNFAENLITILDAGGDTLTVSASVGDIVDQGNDQWLWSLDTGDSRRQSVTITATDADGESTLLTFQLLLAPAIQDMPPLEETPVPSATGPHHGNLTTGGVEDDDHALQEILADLFADSSRWW